VFEGIRVAVSGGAGVIGTTLVDRLHRQGARVWVGDLKPRPVSFAPDVIYRWGDLNFLTAPELAAFDPQVFIHLAATFERSVETPEFWSENYRHNVCLSNHLVSLLEGTAVDRVVFASSYLIYDPRLYLFSKPQEVPRSLNEGDPVYPRNLCGAAKFFHEHELQFQARATPGRRFSMARIFRGYGRGSRDVISRWTRDLLQDRPIDVFRTEGMFDFTYADDTAEALIRLAAARHEGIVNVGSGRARKVADVLAVLRQHFPGMQAREAESDIAFEASQADISLLVEITGWRPGFTLESAIPQIIDYERAGLAAERTAGPSRRGAGRASPGAEASGVLVTSVSRKVPMLEAVRSAVRKIGRQAQIVGADMQAGSIASHFVDRFWQMPPLAELTVGDLIRYCQQNGIGFIIPSRDDELEFFAAARAELAGAGIEVMISSRDAVTDCRDKLRFSERLLAAGFPAIPTFASLGQLPASRIVVKERYGAGAAGLLINADRKAASAFAATLSNPIFQEWVTGTELSVDVYVDRSGHCKGAVARRRDVVVGGESQVTTTQRHAGAEKVCSAIAETLGIRGHAVLQVMVDAAGELYVIECNARFGGASTLSLAAGLDSFYWFLLEAGGEALGQYPFARAATELRQVRFACDRVVECA